MPQDAEDAADIQTLQAIAREFTEGFNSGDVDRIMQFYGDQYVDVNLRNPIQTRSQRRQYYLDIMQRRKIRVEVHPEEIHLEGLLAFIRGTIDIMSPDGSRSELRYLEIARKRSDGSWIMMWGMDGPVQEYEPAQN